MTIREHYSHAIADEHKRKKRAAAEERAKLRAERGDAGQIVKLNRQGTATTPPAVPRPFLRG